MANTISIYDHNTGEHIVREMTAEEQAQYDAEVAEYEAKKAAKEAEAQALRQAKISAYEKLGLTAEEIEALVPTSKAPVII